MIDNNVTPDYKQLYDGLIQKRKDYSKGYNKKTNYKAIKKYLQDHPAVRMYNTAKTMAKKRGIEFTITVDELIIPEYCPYLGIPLTNIFGRGRVKTNVSLDRIDSEKGYISGNVQIISDLANRMKQDATPEELVAFARGVLKTFGERVGVAGTISEEGGV